MHPMWAKPRHKKQANPQWFQRRAVGGNPRDICVDRAPSGDYVLGIIGEDPSGQKPVVKLSIIPTVKHGPDRMLHHTQHPSSHCVRERTTVQSQGVCTIL
ncbi:hypothetical protein Hamer_G002498 [Homarus americanus]|uniref:Uncharacterized protein n=1 Tax=Homarus americanus TaxID=6706 RepID=A0A8J5K637_HOMAM|nr:hypothetical protein Hamer_G002498 [Homarus americanus]